MPKQHHPPLTFALSLGLATVLWGIMFSPWTVPLIDFWTVMSISALLLTVTGVYLGRHWRTQFVFSPVEIGIGIISAAVLWFIFYMGHFFSTLLFDFATPQIGSIYAIKAGKSPILIGLLLLFLIGPAEEIFWRGYLQRTLIIHYGENRAWIFASLAYALVHIWAFNFMLLMAALICGIFWGALYRWRKNLTATIVSHALWDVAVFLWFPLG